VGTWPPSLLVAVERDRGVAVYRVGSGKFVWQQPEANVGEVQFLNDETLLVATTKGELRVLATENGSEISHLTGYSKLDRSYKRPACFLSVASDKGLIAVGNELRVALWRYGVEPPTETLPASIAPQGPLPPPPSGPLKMTRVGQNLVVDFDVPHQVRPQPPPPPRSEYLVINLFSDSSAIHFGLDRDLSPLLFE